MARARAASPPATSRRSAAGSSATSRLPRQPQATARSAGAIPSRSARARSPSGVTTSATGAVGPADPVALDERRRTGRRRVHPPGAVVRSVRSRQSRDQDPPLPLELRDVDAELPRTTRRPRPVSRIPPRRCSSRPAASRRAPRPRAARPGGRSTCGPPASRSPLAHGDQRAGRRRLPEPAQPLQQLGDLRPRQPDVTCAALRLGADEPPASSRATCSLAAGRRPRASAPAPTPSSRAVEHRQAHRRPALVAEQARPAATVRAAAHAGAPSGTRVRGFRRARPTPTRASAPRRTPSPAAPPTGTPSSAAR